MPSGLEADDTMVYRLSGGEPWHHMGQGVPDDIPDSEFFKLAGLDWRVVELPLYIQGRREQRKSRYKALVRSTDGKELGVATESYHPVQNSQIWEFFQKFCEAGRMRLETAGSLCGGSRVWALARTDKSFTINGKANGSGNGNGKGSGNGSGSQDVTGLYVLFSTGHEPGFATQVEPTSVRVVCRNTLNLARNAGVSDGRFRLSHRAVWHPQYVEEAQRVVTEAIGLMDYHQRQAEILHGSPSDRDLNRAYLTELFQPELVRAILEGRAGLPVDEVIRESHEQAGQRVMASLLLAEPEAQADAGKRILDTLTRAVAKDEVYQALSPTVRRVEQAIYEQPGPDRGSTLWGTYNGVSWYVDAVRGRNPSSAVNSALFGEGRNLKVKAAGLALDYAKRMGNTDAVALDH